MRFSTPLAAPTFVAVLAASIGACAAESADHPGNDSPARAAIAERQLTDWPGIENNAKFSPDGEMIAFDAVVDGQSDLYIMRLADGAVTRLTDAPSADRRPAWSPDGQTIAFQSDRGGYSGIWSMPAAGGEAMAVFGDATHSAIGPDFSVGGRLVATVLEPDTSRDYGHVTPWVMGADGSDPRSVTTGGDEWWAQWGSGGEWLYYYNGSRDDVDAVHADSGEVREISRRAHIGFRPTASPDGSSLAFVSPPGWSIWIRPLADRPELLRLTTTGREDFPGFSPDSRSLVFSSDRSRSQIVSLTLATRDREVLVEGARPGPLEADGSFAFVRQDGDPMRPMFFDATTASSAPLPVALGGSFQAAVAPDGGPIAVAANGGVPNLRFEIHVAERDGSNLRQVTARNTADSPTWCDGTDFVYHSANDEQTEFSQIYRIELATGESTQLTHEPYGKEITGCTPAGEQITARLVAGRTGVLLVERTATGPWSERLLIDAQEGALSPDGKRLAFVRNEGGRTDVFLREADGTIVRLTDDDLVESSPRWSADGARIVFAATLAGRDLWLLTLPDLPWRSASGEPR